MTSLLLALVVSGAISAEPTTEADVAVVESRTPRQWRADVHAALKAQATAEAKDQDAAMRQLLDLYSGLKHSEDISDLLRKSMQRKLRLRLVRLHREVVAKGEKAGDRVANGDAETELPESVATEEGPRIHAQNGFFGDAAGGGRNKEGQDLAELIETTIARDTWVAAGGTGTIVYWAPGKALVVTNQGEVHDDLGDLIEGLRDAGGL